MFKLTAIATALFLLISSSVSAQESAPPAEDPASLSTARIADPTTKELFARKSQPWLTQINRPYANQLASGNGAGVMVGIVDTGINMSNTMIRNRVVATYNGTTGTTNVTDTQGHGTHVAGIVAGNTASGALLEGVATGSSLLIAKVFENGQGTALSVSRGLDWTVNIHRAPIVNMSLGFTAPAITSSVQNAVNRGTLITAAMGNTGRVGALWPAAYAKESWARGQIIAVGALDANNKKASFSTWDPTLAQWVVYAPGSGIISSYNTGYSSLSGTSMAAPMVAGQAALIKSNWNFLPAADIAQIIFKSADAICVDTATLAQCRARTAPDPVYGWGKINIANSLQPLGVLTVPNSPGSTVGLSGTMLASPKSGLAAGLASMRTIALDQYRRGFIVDLSSVSSGTKSSVSSIPITVPSASVVAGNRLFAQYSLTSNEYSAETATVLSKLAFSTSVNGTSLGFGTGGTTDQFFGLGSTGAVPLSLTGKGSNFNSPYLSFADRAQHIGYSVKLDSGAVVRVGAVVQNSAVDSAMLSTIVPQDRASTITAEIEKTFGKVTTVLSVGQLSEQNSALGLQGTGALAINNSVATQFLTLAATAPIADKTSVSVMASTGTTSGYRNQASSLIDGASAVQSAAWALGLARNDLFSAGDRVGVTLAMPLRTISGSMQVTNAVDQSQLDGSLTFATQEISLAPSGQQRNLEFAYTRPTSKMGTISASAVMQLDPGHVAGAATEYGLGVKYQLRF